jgi:GxxExxY protein
MTEISDPKGGCGGSTDSRTPFKSDALTESIIGGIIRVHSTLGPGFVESIYRRALLLDLSRAGLGVEPEREVDVFYLGERVGWHRMDLIVERNVVVERKSWHWLTMPSSGPASGPRAWMWVFSSTSPERGRTTVACIRFESARWISGFHGGVADP